MFSEKDGARGLPSRNKRGVLLWDVIFAEKGTSGTGPTGDIDATLDGERHAMERPELRAVHHQTFRRARLLTGTLRVRMDKRIPFRLQRLDAFKMAIDDFDGRNILGSNFVRDFR